jgi:UPF0716 protein FxsA
VFGQVLTVPYLILTVGWVVAEALMLVVLSSLIGAGRMVLLLMIAFGLGVMLIYRQGLRTLHALRNATEHGELPAVAILEGALSLAAGLFLILPGPLSDLVALLLLLLPVRRRIADRAYRDLAKARPDLRQALQPVTLDGEFRRRT